MQFHSRFEIETGSRSSHFGDHVYRNVNGFAGLFGLPDTRQTQTLGCADGERSTKRRAGHPLSPLTAAVRPSSSSTRSTKS